MNYSRQQIVDYLVWNGEDAVFLKELNTMQLIKMVDYPDELEDWLKIQEECRKK